MKIGKKRLLEMSIILVVIGGALTYQIMHEKAAQAEIIEESVPELGKQQLDEPKEFVSSTDIPLPVSLSKQQLVQRHISSLNARGLRSYNPHLSLLGDAPEWAILDDYQNTISKETFIRLLTSVYTIGEDWKKWITIEDDHALIVQAAADSKVEQYRLSFAQEENVTLPRYWRSAEQLGPASQEQPLSGMTIAIDPGHLGGEQWAELEERDFAIGNDKPVREGEITLKVANLLKPQLEFLGAEVVLVRESLDAPISK